MTHAWVPRRWLYPDGARWLAQWPWRPDYALRLVRNDPALLRFPALLHCTVRALGPCRYLRAPLYHADLLLTDAAGRARKRAAYEREMPGFVIDGVSLNEVYYLPERAPDLRLAPVPAEDAAAVARVPRAPAGARAGCAAPRRPGALADGERRPRSRASARRARWATTPTRAARCCSTTTCASSAASGARSTSRSTTAATRRWPGGMDALPQIRLAYRWRGADGALPEEGARTGLPAPLAPGASAVVPLQVLGPAPPGAREIEIDLVHEQRALVRRPVRARVEVRAPGGSARATRTSAL